MPKRTVKSCGSDASQVGVKSQRRRESPTGPELPVSVRRRGQKSPIPRDEREISRKTIAQGMSDRLRCPVRSCALSFALYAHETAGAARIRHSLLPLLWGDNDMQASGAVRGENAEVWLSNARLRNTLRCHHPRKRMIQYSRDASD